MAFEYEQLPDDLEELKQMVLKSSSVVDALRAEVLRLRRLNRPGIPGELRV